MTKFRTRALGAAIAAGALVALPAAAAASPISAATSVAASTERADSALAKAGSLFEAGKDRQALKSLNRSRAELGKATAAAAKLVRTAGAPSERAAAATAVRLVATQRDENVAELAKMLAQTDSAGAERSIAKAALADVKGREKAIGVLQGLLVKGMPDKAALAINRAIANLSADREDEVAEATEAVSEGEVSRQAVRTMTRVIDESLRGQARAATTITALLETAPAAAKPGLQRALAAISGQQRSAATGLKQASAHMPAAVRSFVDGIIRRALGGSPVGGETTTGGVSVPTGPSAGVPAGPPAGVPMPGLPVNVPVSIPLPSIPVDVPFGPLAGGSFSPPIGGLHR